MTSKQRLAVSMIAWPKEQDAEVAWLLQSLGVTVIEATPARIVSDPTAPSYDEICRFREFWESRGIRVGAMQALLFGAPHMALFEGPQRKAALKAHLTKVFVIASRLGATRLVFGSPANRLRRELPVEVALDEATVFFREAGKEAHDHGVELLIEANPKEYGGDFILTTLEALDLVERVATPGFGLHIDTGSMSLSNEPPFLLAQLAGDRISHFHVSEPQLTPVGAVSGRHQALGVALSGTDYRGLISIEMRATANPPESLRRAIEFVKFCYLSTCE